MKRSEKRAEELKERMERIPKIPKGFVRWVEKKLGNHYLFYKRKGRKVEVTCSGCGKTNHYKIWTGNEDLTLEQQFEHTWEKPEHKKSGKCELCGAKGQYIAIGRKNKVLEVIPCYLWQCLDDKTFVIRYFEAGKTSTPEGEKVEIDEVARNWIWKGKKRVQKDYQKYDIYSGETFWDDCNLYGLNKIPQKEGPVYPPSWKQLEKSHLKYSGLREYLVHERKMPYRTDPTRYLEQYNRLPAMEMFVKLKMFQLVRLDIREWFDEKGKKPEEILKIDRCKLKPLIEYGGNIDRLRLYQMEKRIGVNLKEEEEIELTDLLGWHSLERYERIAGFLSVRKFINHVEKYYEEADVKEKISRYAIAIRWCDYLDMCLQMGYDLTDTIKLFPKDLKAAHDKMVLEVDRYKADMRKKEVNEKYQNIAKQYKRLEKLYAVETDRYIIRPARDAGEIVEEGRKQHHCVGRDYYLNSHNTGNSYILLLRKKETPDVPYITVEIRQGRIAQWYGAYDKKTDQEEIDSFLDWYVQQLKGQKKKSA